MTKEKFLNCLSGDMPYGTYVFETYEFSGMIGRTPGRTVIALYSLESLEDDENEESLYSGEYKTPEEILEKFRVKNQMFSDTMLKEIQEIERVLSA